MSKEKVISLGENGEFTIALSLEKLRDITENKTRHIVFEFPDSIYDTLSEGNKTALTHLVKAAVILDNVFLKQDHPDNVRAKKLLEQQKNTDERIQLTYDLFNTFNGLESIDMYSQKSEPLRLFSDKELAPGKGFYPQDLRKEELVKYIVNHPEQASAILSNNTVVQRNGDRLEAVPYSVAFRSEMEGAARELLEASVHTDHIGFSQYLKWQAQALVNDSDPEMVFKAEKAWITLEDSPLEFTISRELYDDELSSAVAADPKVRKMLGDFGNYGIKAKSKDTFGTRVGIVNKEANKTIANYRQYLEDFSELMPLCTQYNQGINGDSDTAMTFADVDLVAVTGDYNAFRGGLVQAQNLPNNDKLSAQLNVGGRLVFHRQARQVATKLGPKAEQKLLDSLVEPSQHKWYSKEADFKFLIGHELAHSLGPKLTKDGLDKTSSLGKWGDVIEENKADLGSMLMTAHFLEIEKFTQEQANEIYFTWALSCLPSKQPAESEAHRYREVMQINYFCEKGAINFEKDGKFSIIPEKMASATNDMLKEVVQIQLDGDADKAGIFAQKYGEWTEPLQYAANKQLALKPKLYRSVEQPMMKRLLSANL